MSRLRSILIALAIGTVPVVGVFLCLLLWQSKQDEHQLAMQAGTLLTDLQRPCKGPKGPDACGTLAQINKSVIEIGDISKTAQIQVNQTATLVAQYGKVLNGIAGDVHGEMEEAKKTTVALTGTVQQATTTLATVNGMVASTQPRVDALLTDTDTTVKSSNAAVMRFTAMLTDPKIALITDHVEQMTGTTTHMLATADAVETKATKGYLHPPTNPAARAWMYLQPFLIPMAQVGGAVAIAVH